MVSVTGTCALVSMNETCSPILRDRNISSCLQPQKAHPRDESNHSFGGWMRNVLVTVRAYLR